jgi:hypothetical protein
MKFVRDYGPATEDLLEACEERIGRKIPAPYRAFLAEHNGGLVFPDVFDFRDNDGENGAVLHGLLSTRRGVDSLDSYLEIYAGRVPDDLFPIAYDTFGNLVLIGDTGPNAGKVYFWDHEFEADPDEGQVPDYSNVYLIAESLDAFFAALYEAPPVAPERSLPL